MNVACAETDHEAARLRAPSEAAYQQKAHGAFCPPPTVDELGATAEPMPESLEPGEWPRAISGSPATIGTLLERMTDQVDADEVIVQNLVENPTDRIRSHELIAGTWGSPIK